MYVLSHENQGIESGTDPHNRSRAIGSPLWVALAWMLRIGVEKSQRESIRVMQKKNRPTMSRARYGTQELGRAIRWAQDALYTFISLLTSDAGVSMGEVEQEVVHGDLPAHFCSG